MHSKSKFVTSVSRALLIALALLAFTNCAKKAGALDGTYASEDGTTYKFDGDDVTVTRKGAAGGSHMKYAVDGKKVTYTMGTYKYEGVIKDDGSVTMDQEKLVKQ